MECNVIIKAKIKEGFYDVLRNNNIYYLKSINKLFYWFTSAVIKQEAL